MQYSLSTQPTVNANAIGGNDQRNQVIHQDLFTVGKDQNSTHKFKIKIPKKFQRVRAGMDWTITWTTDQTVTMSLQAIYKFYT